MHQEMWEMPSRRYVPAAEAIRPSTASDLHAWSIYRQNLNSDFTDSALGSSEKAPLPYGNFQLRDQTVQSILSHSKYGVRSPLSVSSNAYLKFGLPRVAPPKNGSSGYDSSDDGSPVLQSSRLRGAKSDPDFRNHIIPPQKGSEAWWSKENRAKSNSVADLLSEERREKRDLVSELKEFKKVGGSRSNLLSDDSTFEKRSQGSVASRNSHATTRLDGAVYPRDAPLLNDRYFPRDDMAMNGMKPPHLQIRNLNHTVKGTSRRVLDNVSVEVTGGEILGVLATLDTEGSALLATIAGRKPLGNQVIRSSIILNGTQITRSRLRNRVAYMSAADEPSPDLTVMQTLKFHALLRKPARRGKINEEAKMLALMTDLGLEPVKSSRVGSLTYSEKRRLSLACALQLDTDIVVVDQAAKGMDIFDTFFLVEYLRQWANRGRIVVMTIHPPTYEIFTMLSRIALVSSGRLMYFGYRREMLPYFAFIDFPCPAYKNPADYYLDLVTLDDLSSEALLESGQRVEQLSAAFLRRQEPLSDPGPPTALPPPFKQAGLGATISALWTRHLVYGGTSRFLSWLWVIILAAALSLTIGAIYWDSKRKDPPPEQEDISDRFNLNYALGIVAIWPFLMHFCRQTRKLRRFISMEIREGLYGSFWYYWTEITTSFISSLCIFAALLLPAMFIAGTSFGGQKTADFLLQFGYLLFYFFAMRCLVTGIATISNSPHATMTISAIIGVLSALSAGITVHKRDMGYWVSPLTWGSPLHWVMQPLQSIDVSKLATTGCIRNGVTMQDSSDILVKVSCGVANGTQALEFYDNWYKKYDSSIPALVIVAFWLFFAVLHLVGFFATRDTVQKPKVKRSE